MLVAIDVYGENIEPGKRMIVCRLNLRRRFSLSASFAPSVPNKKPSGIITPHRPPALRRYMIRAMNKSAVSLERYCTGKLLFTLSSVLPPYGGFMPITSTLSLSLKSVTFVPSESQLVMLGASISWSSRFVMLKR